MFTLRSSSRGSRRLCAGSLAAAALLAGSGLQAQNETPEPLSAVAPPGLDVTHATSAARLSPAAQAAAEAGIRALSQNKFGDAETDFQKMLKLSPDNPAALINLGLAEFRLGRAEEAQKDLERAVQLTPDAGLAWMMLGVIHMNQEDIDAATAALAQAVYLSPKSPQAHNYFAVVLAKRGWYDAAEDELRKVLELSPNFAEAHFNLALIYFQQNPPAVELARRHYHKAIELGADPDPAFAAKLNAAPAPDAVQ
jgi:Flp pilus assembly protein TadD